MITNKDSKDSKYKNMISINACYLPEMMLLNVTVIVVSA